MVPSEVVAVSVNVTLVCPGKSPAGVNGTLACQKP